MRAAMWRIVGTRGQDQPQNAAMLDLTLLFPTTRTIQLELKISTKVGTIHLHITLEAADVF